MTLINLFIHHSLFKNLIKNPQAMCFFAQTDGGKKNLNENRRRRKAFLW